MATRSRLSARCPPEQPVKKSSRNGQGYPQRVVNEANLAHLFVKLEE